MTASFHLASLGTGALGLLAWWVGELRDLLPQPLLRLLDQDSARLWVELSDDGGPAFVLKRRRDVQDLGPVDLSGSSDPRTAIRNHLRAVGAERLPVVLGVPDGLVLARTVTLPAVAAENLRGVLRFDMDRLTPFRADEVAFDHRVEAGGAGTDRVVVTLWLLPRATLTEALRRAEALGLAPVGIGVASQVANKRPIDFLAAETPGRRGPAVRTAVLAVLCLLLVSAAALYPLVRLQRQAAALSAEVAAARERAERVEGLRTELAAMAENAEIFVERRRRTPPVLVVLEELTRVMPDGTWLASLRIADGQCEFSGYSQRAALLLARFEGSPVFSQARFQAPVVQDGEPGLERFTIAATLRNGAP